MKKHLGVSLLMSMAVLLTVCAGQAINSNGTTQLSETANVWESPTEDLTTLPPEEPSGTQNEEALVLSINGTVLDVQWEENETIAELLAYVQNESITVNTTIYGDFEQVGSLPQSFSRNDVPITAEPGDIMLYSGNQLVLFFGSNKWSYTKLGQIKMPAAELTELMSRDEAVIELKLQ